MKLTLKAFAKLNLTLDITGLTKNGYHLIETVFQSVSLFDTVSVSNDTDRIAVLCGKNLSGEQNICFSAAKAFFERTKIRGGANIQIEKNIPLSAGLAGGSADAAAVLRGLNHIYAHPLSDDELSALAAKIGADVPFCLFGGTMLASGIGEKLSRLKSCPECDIVIIMQGKKPSTGELYKRMDSLKEYKRPNTSKMCEALDKNALEAVCDNVCNVFEAAWGENIAPQKKSLSEMGALCAELSGSGPSVFGIFESGKGRRAAEKLCRQFEYVSLCNPVNCGCKIISAE